MPPPAHRKALLATITTAKAMAVQQRVTVRRVAQTQLLMAVAARGRKENRPTNRSLRKRTKYCRSACIRCWKV
uniref:Putative secreted peptide n=1 Tax=Anopheles braziliensis TaxID=58242 RepID=A0A2M3ZUT1_9DIPT